MNLTVMKVNWLLFRFMGMLIDCIDNGSNLSSNDVCVCKASM